jgi:septum site-determining protein MinC
MSSSKNRSARVNPEAITIKGIRQGLLVKLPGGNLVGQDWHADLRVLEARLDQNPAFFRGGRVALDVGGRELSRSEIEKVRSLLARHQVDLFAVVSESPMTEAAAQEVGLVIDLGPMRPREPEPAAKSAPGDGEELPAVDSVVVRRTLRSGQSLRHPGHVVVIGDVNPGAEVVAGGDILVWGRVRGVVHAGALGDEGAVICALDLAPTQLRIAGHIARSPEDKRRKPVPEMASVCDGQIEAIPWDAR